MNLLDAEFVQEYIRMANDGWEPISYTHLDVYKRQPYHLIDVPMIKTYINGYSNSEYVLSLIHI